MVEPNRGLAHPADDTGQGAAVYLALVRERCGDDGKFPWIAIAAFRALQFALVDRDDVGGHGSPPWI
jgi:hypothetical protein